MINDNNSQLVDQLLRGIYRLCVNKDDCSDCPFYGTKCMFEEPKPRTWFDEDTIEIQTEPVHIEAVEKREPVVRETVAAAPVQEPDDDDDDTEGTWLVSTTMGSVFSKYVYICSKCGYRKESVLSLTPMTSCPECEKKKAMKA